VVVPYTGMAPYLVESMEIGSFEQLAVSARRPQGPICIGPEAESLRRVNRDAGWVTAHDNVRDRYSKWLWGSSIPMLLRE